MRCFASRDPAPLDSKLVSAPLRHFSFEREVALQDTRRDSSVGRIKWGGVCPNLRKVTFNPVKLFSKNGVFLRKVGLKRLILLSKNGAFLKNSKSFGL